MPRHVKDFARSEISRRKAEEFVDIAGAGNVNELFSLPPADFRASKILHMAWHPKEDIIATAAANSLYFFSGSS